MPASPDAIEADFRAAVRALVSQSSTIGSVEASAGKGFAAIA